MMQSEERESSGEELSEEEEEEQVDARISDEFRRNLRSNYLDLISQTTENAEELCKPGSGEILGLFDKGKEYLAKIVHAREGSLDATWFAQASKYGYEQLQRINLGRDWDPEEFTNKICTKYKAVEQPREIRDDDTITEIDWIKLGGDVTKFFKRTPTITFMHGPIKAERKERKKAERKKRSKDDVTEEKEPEEYVNDGTKQDATTKKVEEMYKSLKKQVKKRKKEKQDTILNFSEVVVDPKSFTKTIENIFYYSFLVKEGKASLSLDPKSEELKSTVVENTNESNRNQSVMKLNLNIFKQIVKEQSEKDKP
ncbi:hypothetical protein ABK040_000072 [Willaertia magna]